MILPETQRKQGVDSRMKPGLYSIGEISKIANIPQRILRYYDKRKVLCPEYRNEDTKYRYYTKNQLPTINRITDLHALGIPFEVIREIQEQKDLISLKKALDNQIIRNQTAMQVTQYQYSQACEDRRRVSYALTKLQEGGRAHKVTFYNIEPCYEICESRTLSREESKTENCVTMFQTLHEFIRKYLLVHEGGDSIIRKKWEISEKESEDRQDIILLQQIKNPPPVPIDNMREFKSTRVLTTMHIGPYDTLHTAYSDIKMWAAAHDIALSEDSLEEYYITPVMVSSPSDLVTQLFIPIAGEHFFKADATRDPS